jgi:hypothetical protein
VMKEIFFGGLVTQFLSHIITLELSTNYRNSSEQQKMYLND